MDFNNAKAEVVERLRYRELTAARIDAMRGWQWAAAEVGTKI